MGGTVNAMTLTANVAEAELTPSERAAILIWEICRRGRLPLDEAARLTGLTLNGAHVLLSSIARTVPIYNNANEWRLVEIWTPRGDWPAVEGSRPNMRPLRPVTAGE